MIAAIVAAALPANWCAALAVLAAVALAALAVGLTLAALLDASVHLFTGTALGTVVPHARQSCGRSKEQQQ